MSFWVKFIWKKYGYILWQTGVPFGLCRTVFYVEG